MERNDAQLVKDYLEGDETALSHLVSRYLASVYNFAYRMTRNKAEADDISAEVFLKVWKNLKKYNPDQSFKAWILSITRNTAIDHFRKRKAFSFSSLKNENTETNFEDTIADTESLPDELFEQKELGVTLEDALSHLSPENRALILLHLNDDLTFEEIAEQLGKPMNTIKSQHRRALILLRKFLISEI